MFEKAVQYSVSVPDPQFRQYKKNTYFMNSEY